MQRPQEKHRVNRRIRFSPVLVIHEGKKLGVMETTKALAIAREAGLDLVEVSPHTRPPVCKILDYSRMKYDEKKKARANKQPRSTTKEMKFSPKTAEHDLAYKTAHVRRFLEAGDKCTLVVQYKGRERAHPHLGIEMIERVAESVADIAEVVSPAKMEGSRATLTLSPKGADNK